VTSVVRRLRGRLRLGGEYVELSFGHSSPVGTASPVMCEEAAARTAARQVRVTSQVG
jgi:hypothetical protein